MIRNGGNKNGQLISIIIPTFRRPDKLLRALRSVLSQSYEEIEVLVIDDNGADTDYSKQTVKKLKEFSTDPRIRLICHERNLGGCAARNTGIRNSRGRFLAFLDDDDEWYNTFLEKSLRVLLNSDDKTGLVYSRAITAMNKRLCYPKRKPVGYCGKVFSKLLNGWCPPTTSLFVVKRECFEDVGFFDEGLKSFQDFDMWLRIAQAYEFSYLDEELVVKHQYEDEQTSMNPYRRFEGFKSVAAKWLEILSEEEKEIFKSTLRRYEMQIMKLFCLRMIDENDRKQARRYYLEFLKKGGFTRPSSFPLLFAMVTNRKVYDLYNSLNLKRSFKCINGGEV